MRGNHFSHGNTSPNDGLMKIYYFIHVTGTDTGISGIPRVVKSLARELLSLDGVQLVPACWNHRQNTLIRAEQKLLDNLSRHAGPKLRESTQAREPVAPGAGDWLLVAEVPHLHSYDRDYPSISIDEPIGWARRHGLKVAVVLHDLLPRTHPEGGNGVRLFSDMLLGDADAGESQRMRFTGYAHALALSDIVLPVSQASGSLLLRLARSTRSSRRAVAADRAGRPPRGDFRNASRHSFQNRKLKMGQWSSYP